MARPKAGVTFWDRVAQYTSIQNNGCHLFTGHKDECGYARIRKDSKLVRVHREVWTLHNGDIPSDMRVCHKCDNPSCINPGHLFLGTQYDNVRDMWSKGRQNISRGEKNGSAKLKAEQVLRIKERIKNNETCYSLAREYGVTGEAVLAIKHGHTWKSLS